MYNGRSFSAVDAVPCHTAPRPALPGAWGCQWCGKLCTLVARAPRCGWEKKKMNESVRMSYFEQWARDRGKEKNDTTHMMQGLSPTKAVISMPVRSSSPVMVIWVPPAMGPS